MGLTKNDAEIIWDDDCDQAFLGLKKALVQPPVLAYPMREELLSSPQIPVTL